MKKGVLSVALALLSVGCTPLRTPPADVGKLGKGEGIVFGSIQIVVKEPDGEFGPNFKDTKWSCTIEPSKSNEEKTGSRKLTVESDSEEYFVARLPAGEYFLKKMVRSWAMGGTGNSVEMKTRFIVEPGETSYIGRIRVTLPYLSTLFFGIPKKVSLSVLDDKDAAVQELQHEYGNTLKDARVHLAIEY